MKQEQILEIIEKQRSFFSSGATLDVNYRIAALKKLQHALKVQEAAIAQAIHADLGKSPEASYMCETGIVLSEINYMLKHIVVFPKNRPLSRPLHSSHPAAIRSLRLTV